MQNNPDCDRSKTEQEIDPIVGTIVQLIEDKIGKNIYAVDIRKTPSLWDYCVIAEGTVDRHVKAIAQHIEKELALLGHKPLKVEGAQEGEWAILDYLNIMVHLLTPTFREKYRLERLWEEGTIIDVSELCSS